MDRLKKLLKLIWETSPIYYLWTVLNNFDDITGSSIYNPDSLKHLDKADEFIKSKKMNQIKIPNRMGVEELMNIEIARNKKMGKCINTDELKNKFKEKLNEYHYFVNKGRIEAILNEISEEREDKFKNSPIHNKRAILEIMDKLEPAQMVKVVDLLNELEQQNYLSKGIEEHSLIDIDALWRETRAFDNLLVEKHIDATVIRKEVFILINDVLKKVCSNQQPKSLSEEREDVSNQMRNIVHKYREHAWINGLTLTDCDKWLNETISEIKGETKPTKTTNP